jgi:ribokinase
MQAFVIGNVTIDETVLVDEMPTSGVSILGHIGAHDLGGKGANQAVVMGRCGLTTTLIAPVGNDARANQIRLHLNDEPLSSQLIEMSGKASDLSLIFRLPDGENANVTSTESAQSLTLSDVELHLASAQPGDLMVLQGNLSDQTTRDVLDHAKRIGMVNAFNPSPLRPYFADLWPLIDIIFLNEGEAGALSGATGRHAAERLLSKGLQQVVVTSGDKGAILVSPDDFVHVPAIACDVVDTTGAGDTFMAVALASAALRGRSLDRVALEYATQAATITVSRAGTRRAFPTMSELGAFLQRKDPPRP